MSWNSSFHRNWQWFLQQIERWYQVFDMCWLRGWSAWFSRSNRDSASVSYRRLPRQIWWMTFNHNQDFSYWTTAIFLPLASNWFSINLNAWIQIIKDTKFLFLSNIPNFRDVVDIARSMWLAKCLYGQMVLCWFSWSTQEQIESMILMFGLPV